MYFPERKAIFNDPTLLYFARGCVSLIPWHRESRRKRRWWFLVNESSFRTRRVPWSSVKFDRGCFNCRYVTVDRNIIVIFYLHLSARMSVVNNLWFSPWALQGLLSQRSRWNLLRYYFQLLFSSFYYFLLSRAVGTLETNGGSLYHEGFTLFHSSYLKPRHQLLKSNQILISELFSEW